MTREPYQGPMKTSRPTMRSLNPAVSGTGGNFTTGVIDARPGTIHQRSQGEVPGEVVTQFAQAPGGFINQHLAGVGTFAAERFEPGDDTNVAGDGDFNGGPTEMGQGSATKVTGKSSPGRTGGKGTI
jgi:hypothetical protein